MQSARRITYRINEKDYDFTVKGYIEGVLIFGSYVNGNFGSHSDIDHLLIVDNEYVDKCHVIEKEMADELGVPTSWVTAYTKKEIRNRCRRGDYFFWSIYLHHIKIYSRSNFINNIFKRMPLYTDVRQNLNRRLKYYQHLMDLWKKDSISSKTLSLKIPHFYRNACINLLYLYGYIEFGKIQSAERCKTLLHGDLPFSIASYKKLLNKRTILTNKEIWAWYDTFVEFHYKILRIEKRKMNDQFISPLPHKRHTHKRAASF